MPVASSMVLSTTGNLEILDTASKPAAGAPPEIASTFDILRKKSYHQ